MLDTISRFFRGNPQNHPADFFRERFKDTNVVLRVRTYTRSRMSPYGMEVGGKELISGLIRAEDSTSLRQLTSKVVSRRHKEGSILNSVHVDQGEEMFVPMVDFVGRPTKFEFDFWHQKMVKECPFLEGTSLEVFDSGNSYHGYMFCLMSPAENTLWFEALAAADNVDRAWLKSTHCLRWTTGTVLSSRRKPRHAYTAGPQI